MIGAEATWRLGRQEWGALAALVAAFLLFLLPGGLATGLAGAVVVVALATRWPYLAAALVPLTFPLTFQPRAFGTVQIAPAEAAIAFLTLALLLRLVPQASRRVSRASRPQPPAPSPQPPLWLWGPALGLLAVASLSLLTVAEPTYLRESLREYRTVIVVPVLYAGLAWLTLRQPRDCLLALLALGLAGAAVGLGAVAEALLGLGGVTAEGVRRAVGVFPHPNHLALFCGRAAAGSLGLALAWPGATGRWLALGLAGGAAAGLLVSFSRGGWFAFLATVLCLALLTGHRRLALAVAGGTAALLLLLPLTGVERLSRLFAGDSGSGMLRLDIWQSTLAMLIDHPLTGVGLDQFLYQYPRYVTPAAWGERFTAHPHNLVLDFWVRLGILGLAVGASMIGLALRATVRLTRSRRGRHQALAAGAGGLLLYGLLHGLVDNGFFLPDLALIFWLASVVLARVASAARPAGATAARPAGATG